MLDQAAPTSPPTPADATAADTTSAVVPARWLRICVTRHTRVVVQVCFPSYAVLSLGDLVPDDVRRRVVEQEVDLEKVAANAASMGCLPGELFSITTGEHAVRAWLD